MENITLISMIYCAINMAFIVHLIVYLTKNNKKFPFSNINPVWKILLLYLLGVHQLLNIFVIYLEVFGYVKQLVVSLLIKTVFIHYIILCGLIAR